MRILGTSASGANGHGYGAILGFGAGGEFTGPFGFGPDGRLFLSSGAAPSGQGDNTIVVFDRSGNAARPAWSPTPN